MRGMVSSTSLRSHQVGPEVIFGMPCGGEASTPRDAFLLLLLLYLLLCKVKKNSVNAQS